MGFFNKFMNDLKFNKNEDDGFLDDEYPNDEEYDENYDGEYEEREGLFSRKPFSNEKSSGLFGRRVIEGGDESDTRVISIKSSGMKDTRAICDSLLNGKAVIMNLEAVPHEDAQRMIDFMTGAVYSINGQLKQITSNIFIVSPSNVNVTGDFLRNSSAMDYNYQTRNSTFSLNV